MLLSSIATGIIFIKNMTKDNLFIFIAFSLYVFTMILNLFFGYSVTVDPETNLTIHLEGMLSSNQTNSLLLLSNLLFALGFSTKAYKSFKKT